MWWTDEDLLLLRAHERVAISRAGSVVGGQRRGRKMSTAHHPLLTNMPYRSGVSKAEQYTMMGGVNIDATITIRDGLRRHVVNDAWVV